MAEATRGARLDPDHAVRSLRDALAADRPCALTRDVQREAVEARFAAVREAFVRARR